MKKNNKTFSFKEFKDKSIYFFKNMSYAKSILIIYLIITLVGAFLLWLPISKTGYTSFDPVKGLTKGEIPFINSLFTAASAFSDTGLTTNTTSAAYTEFGQAIIAILIFVGGIGFFALKVYIFNILLGRNISYRLRQALAAERGSIKVGVSYNLIKVAVTTLLIIILIFALSLTAYFYYTDISGKSSGLKDLVGNDLTMDKLLQENPYKNIGVALKFGFFHTISAINNAGFDIMGGNSLQPYYYQYSIQIIFFILFLIGGIGYPVIYDVYMYFKTRITGRKFSFSLFTKISMVTYLVISLIGLTGTFMSELLGDTGFWNDTSGRYGDKGDKVMALFFNTLSTRNAGFSTINIHSLSKITLVQYSILMFIGSAPSSTAGGIRTITIAIIFLSLWGRIRGRSSTYAFKRRISGDTVNRAFTIFFISIMLVLFSAIISTTSYASRGGQIPSTQSLVSEFKDKPLIVGDLMKENVHYGFVDLFFESASAFGTTGLSTGITSLLNTPSKIILLLLMFIGQLGVSSSLLIWDRKNNRDKSFKWVKENITIG